MEVTLHRSDFTSDSEGMDHFDYVLSALGIPEDEWPSLDEVTFPTLTKEDFKVF